MPKRISPSTSSASNVLLPSTKRLKSSSAVSANQHLFFPASAPFLTSGGSFPFPPPTAQVVKEDEVKLRRLEKNRDAARESRRRKREHIEKVQAKCRVLEAENLDLQAQLRAGEEAHQQEERRKEQVCRQLAQMVHQETSDEEIGQVIRSFEQQYADYGQGRRAMLKYHLQQLEKLLLPTQVTKMCMWALNQDKDSHQDAQNAEEEEEDDMSLSGILSKELELTANQKQAIRGHREAIGAVCERLREATRLLGQLQKQVEEKNTVLDQEMEKLQHILTPTQRAKFIVWVTENPACVHLLNKLWK